MWAVQLHQHSLRVVPTSLTWSNGLCHSSHFDWREKPKSGLLLRLWHTRGSWRTSWQLIYSIYRTFPDLLPEKLSKPVLFVLYPDIHYLSLLKSIISVHIQIGSSSKFSKFPSAPWALFCWICVCAQNISVLHENRIHLPLCPFYAVTMVTLYASPVAFLFFKWMEMYIFWLD